MSSQAQMENWSHLFAELQAEMSGCLAKLSVLQSQVCRNGPPPKDAHAKQAQDSLISCHEPVEKPAKRKGFKKKGVSEVQDVKKRFWANTAAITAATEFAAQAPSNSGSASSAGPQLRAEANGSQPDHFAPNLIGRTATELSMPSMSPSQWAETPELLGSVQLTSEKILETLLTGKQTACQSMMATRVDPNTAFGAAQMPFMRLTECTPLAVAVMRRQQRLVKWLLEDAADPDSRYGFAAGALGMTWTGPCAHATIPAGDLLCLQQLLKSRADVHALSSNGASLLFHASYFNQVSIVEFLLMQQSDLEERATSPDDVDRAYTPLHAAAKGGHHAVAVALLDAKAEADVNDMIHEETPSGKKSTAGSFSSHVASALAGPLSALQDAIDGSHDSIARLLIENGDNSLCAIATSRPSCLESAFDSGNTKLISAIAKGLKKNPALLDKLTRKDVVRFLCCNGETPVLILQSIFQPCKLLFWQEGPVSGRNVRHIRNTAFLTTATELNARTGPHPREFSNFFKAKKELSPTLRDFLDALAPQERRSDKQYFTSVNLLACHIPSMHKHLDVLIAIADSPCDELFKEATCCAIIKSTADKVKAKARFKFVAAGLEVINLVVVNYILNNSQKGMTFGPLYVDTQGSGVWLQCAIVVGFVISGMDLFVFALEAFGFWCQGLLERMVHEVVSLGSVVGNLVVLMIVDELGVEAKQSPIFCTALGAVIFLKWMLVLLESCQIRTIGMQILPIMACLADIGPFFLVMSVCIIASANLYYAFGLYSAGDSFYLIYRLAVLGDFNLDELENKFGTDMNVTAGGSVVMSVAAKTDYYWVVRVMLLFVGFTMSISLMNLFIGVLTVSYSAHTERAAVSYLRWRAGTVLEGQAVRLGWKTLSKFFQREDTTGRQSIIGRRTAHEAFQAMTANQSQSSENVTDESSGASAVNDQDSYMWVCTDRREDHL